MYGTIMMCRVKPGKKQDLEDFFEKYGHLGEYPIEGHIGSYILWRDSDPESAIIMTIFDNREAYWRNAQSDEQHDRYLQIRSMIEDDPTWNDGDIKPFLRF
ncbi:MAG TPA: antibiotic biosynthesis monooxygenase [Dehalococcoidia bacterium]|nr:antibiotic biosynthesis monooxygenase [Dehalococcoidia bacterium]